MARGDGNILLKGIKGRIGKELVIKHYGDTIVIAKYPRETKHKPTNLKKIYESRFAAAIKFSRAVRSNNELIKQYKAKLKPGQRLCDYLISEYLQLAKSCKILPKF